jgi:hypothetical protein
MFMTNQTITSFLNGILALLSDTLAAMWSVPVFRFFLAFALLAVIYALSRYLFTTAKGMM